MLFVTLMAAKVARIKSDNQQQQCNPAPQGVSFLALLHALLHGSGLKVNELLPRCAILVECWDHVFAQRCHRLVTFLVQQQLLGFCPGRLCRPAGPG